MIDVSRNGLLHVDGAIKMLRKFALMGLNMCLLYNEDTYEVPGGRLARPALASQPYFFCTAWYFLNCSPLKNFRSARSSSCVGLNRLSAEPAAITLRPAV